MTSVFLVEGGASIAASTTRLALAWSQQPSASAQPVEWKIVAPRGVAAATISGKFAAPPSDCQRV